MATGVRIHPAKLTFSDPELEHKIREKQYAAASPFYMMLLGVTLSLHVITPWVSPRYAVISYIYLPLIMIAIGVGIYFPMRVGSSQLPAHEACSRVWMGLLTVGPGLQRVSIYVGLHPRIEPMQAIIYMASYVGVVLLMYIMHFPFYHKLYNKATIFLSLSTAGWEITGDQGWTAFGQPYDTIIIAITLLVGSLFGYCFERMLRVSFLQRHVELQSMSSSLASLPSGLGFARESASEFDELMSASAGMQYETVGLLGRGGTGDVFLVRKRASGELSAMKRIAKVKMLPTQVARVLEECAILRGIAHPFIVQLESAHETPRFFLLEMTYAGGGDLTNWMGRFTAAAALVVGATAHECSAQGSGRRPRPRPRPHVPPTHRHLGPAHNAGGSGGAARPRVPARPVDPLPRCEAREHARGHRRPRDAGGLWRLQTAAGGGGQPQHAHPSGHTRLHGARAVFGGGVLV